MPSVVSPLPDFTSFVILFSVPSSQHVVDETSPPMLQYAVPSGFVSLTQPQTSEEVSPSSWKVQSVVDVGLPDEFKLLARQ